MNERITEIITRELLKNKEFYNDDFIVEEQKSKNPRIIKLLKNASKGGKREGNPDFIITTKKDVDFVIIIECKADIKNHKSSDLSNAVDYAVDGALHYASYLAKDFNVLAIGISGQKEEELLIDTYLWIKKSNIYKKLKEIKGILSYQEYKRIFINDSEIKKKKEAELMMFARKLHNQMRDYAKLSESEKPLLVSAILMALDDDAFTSSYRSHRKANNLSKVVTNTIERVVNDANMPDDKIKNLVQTYGFLNVHPELNRGMVLMNLIMEIEENIKPFINEYENIDIIGKFYGEFLKYTGGDRKGLGIVLTPRHITELFVEMANLTPESIVLDTCCGTGGFLISAMDNMIKKAGGNKEIEETIRKENLIGVEQQPNMYALGVANMLLRGDGKANIYLNSCFDVTEELKKRKATHFLINPPYGQKNENLSELNFIEHALKCLEPNGLGFAIVPMSCALDIKNPIRERLLKEHTLEAVMSMPEDLFYPVGVVTVIMVFKAHIPHNKHHETWFGFWKNDGFEKTRNEGRVDLNHKYKNEIKWEWLEMFHGRKVIPGKSVKKHVTAEDEWVCEAYMETDLSKINEEDFKYSLLSYMSFNLLTQNFELVNEFIQNIQKDRYELKLNMKEWKSFKLDELFEIENGKGPSNKLAFENPGNTPFVTSTANNNGASSFTLYEPTHKGNTITLNKNGSIGECFYQPNPFCATADVAVLNPKFNNNQYISLFIISIMKKEKYRYNYGRKWNIKRIKSSIIKLPATQSGNSDWGWMEKYIKSLRWSKEL